MTRGKTEMNTWHDIHITRSNIPYEIMRQENAPASSLKSSRTPKVLEE